MSIDSLYVEFKTTSMKINEKFIARVKSDRNSFSQVIFDEITNNRLDK